MGRISIPNSISHHFQSRLMADTYNWGLVRNNNRYLPKRRLVKQQGCKFSTDRLWGSCFFAPSFLQWTSSTCVPNFLKENLKI
jgi:hypothetical protein